MNGKLTLCEYIRVHDMGTRYDAEGAGIFMETLQQFPETIACNLLTALTLSDEEKKNVYPFEIRITDTENISVGDVYKGTINTAKAHSLATTIYASSRIRVTVTKETLLSWALYVNGVLLDVVKLEIRKSNSTATKIIDA